MRILITGAAGSLGKVVCEQFRNISNYQILATDIKPNPWPISNNDIENPSASFEYQALDITQDAFISAVKQFEPEIVIHLASILQLSDSIDRQKAYQIDVQATETLLQTAAELKVKKFIITTSGAAYGYHPRNNNKLIDESWPTEGNDDYFYSDHKAKIENLLAISQRNAPEMQHVIFRPGAILGPDFQGPVIDMLRQKFIPGLIGYDAPFNFIWASDVAGYITEAIHSDHKGAFNLVGDGTISLRELAQRLHKTFVPLPVFLVKFLLSFLHPLKLSKFGPEQVKFLQFRPVLSNKKLRDTFIYQPKYNTLECLNAFIGKNNND